MNRGGLPALVLPAQGCGRLGAVVCLGCLVAAASIWARPPSSARWRRTGRIRDGGGSSSALPRVGQSGSPWQLAAACLLGVGVVAIVGFPWGLPAGALATWAGVRWFVTLEPAALRAEREAAAAEMPLAADLLAACVEAGTPLEEALSVVCGCLGPAVGRRLAPVMSACGLGADPAVAWAELGADPVVAALSRPVARAYASGTPLSAALVAAAADVRDADRARAEAAAARASVQVVAPLGLCFLPAFVLVGVVPMVVSAAGTVTSW